MNRLLLSTALASTLGFAFGAAAQTAEAVGAPQASGAAGPQDQAVSLEEVVVTAQRREETLQATPVTVTAVGSDLLAKQNVTDFADLTAVLPNTQVTIAGGARVTVAVRGIRNNDFSPGAESPVAVHIDGSYIPRMTGLQGLFYDIARVESLPGPQGTLYGRNAAAGAINIITNRPTSEREGAAEVEFGDYNLFRGFGMLNVPLTDDLSIRGAFQSLRRDPYNKAGGDDADQTSGRFSAAYERDRLSVFASIDYTKIGGKGTVDNDIRNPPYDSTRIYSRASTELMDVNIEQIGGTVQLDYDIDFATATLQLSQRNSDEESFTRGGDQLSYFEFKSRAKIAEFRLTSASSEPFSWVVGVFGFQEKQPSFGVTSANSDNPFGAGGTCDALNSTPTIPPCGNYLPQLNLKTQSYAVFGQTTWTPIDPLHLTLGLRYSSDEKDYDGAFLCQVGGNGQFFNLNTCQNAPISIALGSPAKNNSTDYKLGVSYDLTEDSLLYANTSTGYRAGGSFISPFFPTYGPEKVRAYEIGWKNQFFGRRLIVNVDAYQQDYDDYIFTYGVTGDIVPAPGVFVPFSATQADNLGSVKIKGADLIVTWLASANDLINFSLEWIDTEIGEATLRCGPPPARDNGPCVVNAFTTPAGKALPNTPEWRFTGAYEHTFDLANGGTLVPRVQTHWESGRWMDLSRRAGTRQEAFTQTDASITYRPQDEAWFVSAWVQNLEDEAVYLTAGASNGQRPVEFPSGVTATYRAPRTFGVKVGASF